MYAYVWIVNLAKNHIYLYPGILYLQPFFLLGQSVDSVACTCPERKLCYLLNNNNISPSKGEIKEGLGHIPKKYFPFKS